MVQVRVDGVSVSVEEGSSALDALRAAGLDVPTACSDPRLESSGACRLCIVRLEGVGRPIASCAYKVKEGDSILVNQPDLENYRRDSIAMLAKDYPASYVEEFPEKTLHVWLKKYGLVGGGKPGPVDRTNPYFRFDPAACIECFRCVRICSELQGSNVWQIIDRGPRTHVIPDSMGELAQSACKSCGACADACPTGALVDKTRETAQPDKWTRTVCPYCGVGCELNVGTKGNQIIQVKPQLDAPVNKGHLCVKGRYAHQYVHSPDRITTPLIRKNGVLEPASWEEALSLMASKLSSIKEEYGPDSIAVMGSARAPNEDNYVTQKFARVVIGTNNVDCCARVCHAPTAAAMAALLGTGAATNSYNDLELAKTILVCGANPSRNHPVIGERIKQAVRRGAKLIVIDPKEIEFAGIADVHVQLKVGTNVPLLSSMAHVVIEEGLVDKEFLAQRIEGFEEFKAEVAQWHPDHAATVTGVPAETIRAAARLYATNGPAMSCHGLGMTEHHQGVEGIMCLVNLALITGNIGKPGSGINPLRGQNNVQGSAHMGCEPHRLAGYVPIAESAGYTSEVWGVPIPTQKGMNLMEMLDAAHEGKLKCMWVIGYDIYFTNPNTNRNHESFSNMDFVVVQDMFLNETARQFAHIVLPACSSFERAGTFMNAERRVQLLRPALDPIGESKTDWEIIQLVAQRMGYEKHFSFTSAEDIWNEVRQVWKAGGGISYDRLRQKGIQWPCPTEDHPGTTILHREKFNFGEKTTLRPIEFVPTPERTNDEFPFILNSGRSLYQFNAGTMTDRTKNHELAPIDYVEIHPDDAAKLGLNTGDQVRVISRYGQVEMPLKVDKSQRVGELFATFHSGKVFLNHITSNVRDRKVSSPEYKVTAVRLEKV